MKQVLPAIALSLLTTGVLATPVYHPPGPNLTYGSVSNNQTIMSSITNPAAGAAVFINEDSQYRFGIVSSIGFGFEAGKVGDLFSNLDQTITKYTETQTLDIQKFIDPNNPDPFQTADAIAAHINSTVIKDTNLLMDQIAKDGYFRGFASGHVPVFPLVISHKKLTGSFVFDVNASVTGLMTFLSDPLADFTGQDLIDPVLQAINSNSETINYNLLDSDSTILVKGGAVAEIALGYSRPVWKHTLGQLFAGVRTKYYQVGLTRVAQRLLDFTEGENSEDAFNYSDDDYKMSSGFGLDAGLLWVNNNYRIGATLANINQPSFKYNDYDVSKYTSPNIKKELEDGSTYEMAAQLTLEGATYTSNQHWVIGGSLDANAVKDPVGQEYQWLAVSAAYATDSWLIPGARIGYRANLAGTKLSYVTGGFTLFKGINFDVAYGLESTNIDKNDIVGISGDVPRSIIMNIGWELTF